MKKWIPIYLFLLALIFSFVIPLGSAYPVNNSVENFLRWLIFCNIGLQGVWAWMGHTFFAEDVAKSIGWTSNPFQFEVAVANLGFGVAGLLAPWHSFDFQLAIVIAESVFLWGAAYGHIRDIFVNKNYAPNNAGPILYTDILVPVTLWILIVLR